MKNKLLKLLLGIGVFATVLSLSLIVKPTRALPEPEDSNIQVIRQLEDLNEKMDEVINQLESLNNCCRRDK